MDLNNLSLFNALLISIVGFITVFTILVVIMILVNLSAKLINKFELKKVQSKPIETNTPVVKEVVASKSNDDEIRVIIAAAVEAYLNSSGSKEFVIRDIKKVNNHDTPWISSSKMNNFNRI